MFTDISGPEVLVFTLASVHRERCPEKFSISSMCDWSTFLKRYTLVSPEMSTQQACTTRGTTSSKVEQPPSASKVWTGMRADGNPACPQGFRLHSHELRPCPWPRHFHIFTTNIKTFSVVEYYTVITENLEHVKIVLKRKHTPTVKKSC